MGKQRQGLSLYNLSNEHATIKSVVCQMSDVRNFAFFIHTAMLHERLLSTCGPGENHRQESTLHYVEANVDREPIGWGHFQRRRAVWRLGRQGCKAFL